MIKKADYSEEETIKLTLMNLHKNLLNKEKALTLKPMIMLEIKLATPTPHLRPKRLLRKQAIKAIRLPRITKFKTKRAKLIISWMAPIPQPKETQTMSCLPGLKFVQFS